ncbi:ATP-binding protein, partial [Escherichia coli]
MQATVPEIDSIIESVTSAFREFGGFEKELLPKNEDIPLPFDGNNLVAYLEALAQENGSEQYVEYLVARIRTMLSDTRMRSVTNDADNRIDLAKWLEKYLGTDCS